MKIKISVITVVKNDEKNILTTVLSVISQKRCVFEYIILDGNSSDNTYKQILNLKGFKYFNYKDKNLYDGINKAIKLSKGEYVFLLHSGDFFKNNLVLCSLAKKLRGSPDIISGNLKYYYNEGKKKIISRVWRHPIRKIDKYSIFKVPHTTMLVKKKIIKKLNFYDTNYSISSDMDFLIRLSNIKKLKYVYIDKFLIMMKGQGLSTSKKNFFSKLFQDLHILYKYFNLNFFIIYFYKIKFKIFDFFKK